MTKKLALSMAVVMLTGSVSRAQLPGTLAGLSGSGAEFFVGRIEGKPLITVNLLSGVGHPGVYHVPIQTNLSQLMAFAGGASNNADLSDITIRSQTSAGTTVRVVDLEELFEENGSIPVLQDRDSILIEQETDYFGRSALYIGIIGGVLSVILSAIAIEKSR